MPFLGLSAGTAAAPLACATTDEREGAWPRKAGAKRVSVWWAVLACKPLPVRLPPAPLTTVRWKLHGAMLGPIMHAEGGWSAWQGVAGWLHRKAGCSRGVARAGSAGPDTPVTGLLLDTCSPMRPGARAAISAGRTKKTGRCAHRSRIILAIASNSCSHKTAMHRARGAACMGRRLHAEAHSCVTGPLTVDRAFGPRSSPAEYDCCIC